MGQLARPISRTLLASALLHAVVFLLLVLRFQSREPAVPIGIDLLYAPSRQAQTFQPVTRTRTRPSLPGKESAKVKAQESVPFSDAPASAGPAVGRLDGVVVTAIERYKFELHRFLEGRKIYPETAKRLHQTGTVVVGFTVSASGDLSNARLVEPAASGILNRSALELIQTAPRFKALPNQVPELELTLPIEYIL